MKLHLFLSHGAALSPKKGVRVFCSFSGFKIQFFSRYDIQPSQFPGAEILKPFNILKNKKGGEEINVTFSVAFRKVLFNP
jgi:hypothetical protein